MFKSIKRIKIGHVTKYIKNMPFYRAMAEYFKYVDFMKKNKVPFGIVKGSNEYYIFESSDIAIPSYMFVNHKTFSYENIELFFKLAAEKSETLKSCVGGGEYSLT